MLTKKGINKRVDDLNTDVKKLTDLIITDRVKRLEETERLYNEQTALLSNVRLRVKSARIVKGDDGVSRLVVTYQLPVVSVALDESGKPSEKDPMFYSINALGLVGQSDYETISRALGDAEKAAIVDNTNKK